MTAELRSEKIRPLCSVVLCLGGVMTLPALLSCGDAPKRGTTPGASDARVVTATPARGAGAPPVAPPLPRRVPTPNPDALPPAPADLPPGRRALQVVDGQERIVDADRAREAGLTLVDLSDGWAPAIFADGARPDGSILPNRYRAVFVGLANDKTDADGQPLTGGEKNYLELLGVPPSLSVLRERMLQDAPRACGEVALDRLLAVQEITTWGATTEQKELARHQNRGRRLETARLEAGASSLVELAARQDVDPKLARDIKAHLRFAAERIAFAEVEKRMACEGLMSAARHNSGRYDTAMRAAVFNFQQKHAVLAQGDLNRATLEAMAKAPLVLDFAALRRVITERAVHAGAIIEDGSAIAAPPPALAGTGAPAPARSSGAAVVPSSLAPPVTAPAPATYLAADGSRRPVPNLAAAATDAVFAALDIVTAEEALAFFRRHAAGDFAHMRLAVRFPELPEYYGAGRNLELSAEIDRGDVWYDFPFDAAGNRLPQPRERYPSFTLYVKWRGERVPLIRWRTTVGSWRSELASDGQEYYAFKVSDVGPRVWRHVVAAPVWLPPASSPLGSMVKEKRVNGAFVKVTNYDQTGPGYLSAYGLVAAIHEQVHRGPDGPSFSDNGIRTHGSFDYTSLRGRFSHGCHRLYNDLAVRLFSFVISHRKVKTLGPVALNFRRTFWWGGELFDLRIPSRGFYFQLDPPLPVETLEGRIRGQRQTPVAGYVQKPGVTYVTAKPPTQDETLESKAAVGGEP